MSGKYRYGFNGKEKDGEIAKDNYDFGARIYDGRIGRWMSVDPYRFKNPDVSPFKAFNNSPIIFVDPDGMDEFIIINIVDSDGKTTKSERIKISSKYYKKEE